MSRQQLSLGALLWVLIIATAHACTSTKPAPVSKDAEGYQFVFDGKSLDGWIYDPVYWRVENNVLVGEVTPATLLTRNSFIIKKDLITRNFELKVEYRISANGNSGINYRSAIIDSLPFAMAGYQADIDGNNKHTGQNYEERKRTTLAYRGQKVTVENGAANQSLASQIKNNAWTNVTVTGVLSDSDSLKAHIRNDEWNEYHLVVKGNRLLHYINGVLMSDVTDNDTLYRQFSGSLGVQVHVGPPMKVEYRNFRIKHLQDGQ